MIQQLLASVAVIQPPTPCDMGPQYSVHVNPMHRCEAGREFVAIHQSHFVALPSYSAWLFVSTAQLPEPLDLTAFGMDACWLMVDPSPKHLQVLTPSHGGQVTRGNGRLVWRWTPPDTMRGAVLYSQMVWTDATENLIGPMLRVEVR